MLYMEKRNYQWHFYSRQLRGPEKRYSATEMEALAVVRAVDHFCQLSIWGKVQSSDLQCC